MSQELNPYAAPVIPEEAPLDLNRDCVLEYENTAARQWAAALVLADRSPLVMLSIVVLGGACFLVYVVGSIAVEEVKGDLANLVFLACFAASPIMAVGAHFLLLRVLAYTELNKLRANPVVGSLGPWQLTIDQKQLSIRNWRGEQSWPLRPMCYVVHDIKAPILWLEPKLPIQLPYAPLSRTHEAQHAHAMLLEFAKNDRR